MIKNYLKVAWRNLMKNKVFSFINVFGLSIGLTCCMLITLYIHHELSYDSYHKNINELYQLGTTFVKQGKEERTPNTPAPMAQEMKHEFPEIRQATRIMVLFAEDKTLLQYKEDNSPLRSFYEEKGYMADSTFFRMFSYDFIEGNGATSLDKPNTVVLSEEIAEKFFGHETALNRIIRISSNTNGDTNFVVTGVFRPKKKPSQIDARFFISVRGGYIEQFVSQQTDMVGNNMFQTFFLLQPGASAKNLESKFPAFVNKYIGDGLRKSGFFKKQFLIPVRDIHLKAGMPVDISAVGSLTYLYILASIAVFTLIIACINFMNLSTARSSKRSAEVGVRKVLGAEKNSLVRQFLGESVLLSMIAFVLALVFTQVLLPGFAAISGKDLSFSFEQHKVLLGGFFVLAIVTGLLAGSYPAFYLSSFQPVKVLKGRISNSLAAISLRKVLVVFQFVISVVLIVASVIINNQMKYMRTKDLGFAKDQQIVIPLRSANAKNIYTSLKDEIRNNSQVKGTGATMFYPGIPNPSDFGLYMEGKTVNDAQIVHSNTIDESLLQTLDIKPIAGRLFSEQFPADTNNRMVMNEAAIRKIGFASPEKAVGHQVHFDWRGETYSFTIVGVVKDFHFQDLHVPIEPYCFQLNNRSFYNYLIVHAKAADVSPLLKSIEASWDKFNPNEPFEYRFLDEDFQKNYQAENRLSAIVGYFTVIAILISCLGLFGLATFSAEQRTKEIGIRKVLGASVGNIIGLLSKEFLKLVMIAVVIASPVAWWAMNKWLQDFAYKANIGWVVFAATAGIALFIALFTISFQAIKAAIANPVKSLRTE
ncbi:MAG TPA: ABC transporter permease [Chitinophagaceae bacterium]|nr:ABC transporter permease [Chitinophagaceae bacterium]